MDKGLRKRSTQAFLQHLRLRGSMVVAGEWMWKKAAEDENFHIISIDARGYSTDVHYRKCKNGDHSRQLSAWRQDRTTPEVRALKSLYDYGFRPRPVKS